MPAGVYSELSSQQGCPGSSSHVAVPDSEPLAEGATHRSSDPDAEGVASRPASQLGSEPSAQVNEPSPAGRGAAPLSQRAVFASVLAGCFAEATCLAWRRFALAGALRLRVGHAPRRASRLILLDDLNPQVDFVVLAGAFAAPVSSRAAVRRVARGTAASRRPEGLLNTEGLRRVMVPVRSHRSSTPGL